MRVAKIQMADNVAPRITAAQIAALARRDAAHPLVRLTAEAVLRRVAELGKRTNTATIMSALHQFVRRSVVYQFEHPEVIKAPSALLEEIIHRNRQGVGDCDDMTALLAALARSLGIQIRLVGVFDYKRGRQHIYPEFYTRIGWLAADPLMRQIGRRASGFQSELYEEV